MTKNKNNFKIKIVLSGDLNVNTFIRDRFSELLLDTFNYYNIYSSFNEPTRIEFHSKSCIDHIFLPT